MTTETLTDQAGIAGDAASRMGPGGLTLRLPDLDQFGITTKGITKAITEYRRLAADLAAAGVAVAALDDDKRAAEQAAVTAQAKAIRAGKPDPDRAHLDELA